MTKYGNLCKDCKIPLTEYTSVLKGKYIQPRCKICAPIHSNSRASRTKEYRAAQWKQWKYGVSIEEYNRRVSAQLEGCAICKQPCSSGRNLAVDHNHKTNQVRDLLCIKCNAILGLVNDNEDYLWDILEYLKRHGLKNAV